jgi:hypothetical protein
MPKKLNFKEDLYCIIEKMNSSEKRYFKLFIKNSQEQDKAYTLIFDLINNSSDEITNKDIEQYLKEHNIKIDVPKAKQYLYKVIIKSLVCYYSDVDDYIENKFRLMELKILSKKNLNHIHLRKLKLLKKHSVKKNKSIDAIESYSILKTSILNSERGEYSIEEIEEILESEKKHITNLYIESELKSVLVKMHRLISSESTMRLEQIKEAYQKLEKSEIFKRDISGSTTIAKLLKYHSLGYIKLRLYKFEEAQINFENYVDILEQEWQILDPDKFNYGVGMANCISSLRLLKKHDEANAYNQKLKSINSVDPTVNLMATELYYINEIRFKIEKRDYESLIVMTEEAFHWMNKEREHITKEATFKFLNYYSVGLVMQKKYSDALDYLNSILFEPKIKVYADDSIVAKILLIICHYYLRNFPIVTSTSKSLSRQLKKMNLTQTAEYNFSKNILKAVAQSQKKADKAKEALIANTETDLPPHLIDLDFIKY